MPKTPRTKCMIAKGTKALLETISFADISVGDICKYCQISRNTFYYHFKDKFDVVHWIFYTEITPILEESFSMNHWEEGLLSLCHYMQQNKKFYVNILHFHGQNSFIECLMEFYENLAQNMLMQTNESRKFTKRELKWICRFYAYGLTGGILDWAKSDMEQDPTPMVKMISNLFSEDLFAKAICLQTRDAVDTET